MSRPTPRWTKTLETCEQPMDNDIVAAVTAPAELGSAAPSDEEEEGAGTLNLA